MDTPSWFFNLSTFAVKFQELAQARLLIGRPLWGVVVGHLFLPLVASWGWSLPPKAR